MAKLKAPRVPVPPSNVIEVLLADGWHAVSAPEIEPEGGLTLGFFLWDLGSDATSPGVLGFRFHCPHGNLWLAGPVSSILAVRLGRPK